MLNANQREAIEALEDAAEGFPTTKRARVYRGLADFLRGEGGHRSRLVGKSMILEDAERRCQELNLTFTKGGSQ